MPQTDRAVDWLLRSALAFSFLYPPIAAWSDPYSWIGYFPAFTRGIVPDEFLLHIFGALEILLALWLLSGWRAYMPASIMAALLLGIVAFNPAQFPVLFRDLGIAAAAIALVFVHWPHVREREGGV